MPRSCDVRLQVGGDNDWMTVCVPRVDNDDDVMCSMFLGVMNMSQPVLVIISA